MIYSVDEEGCSICALRVRKRAHKNVASCADAAAHALRPGTLRCDLLPLLDSITDIKTDLSFVHARSVCLPCTAHSHRAEVGVVEPIRHGQQSTEEAVSV